MMIIEKHIYIYNHRGNTCPGQDTAARVLVFKTKSDLPSFGNYCKGPVTSGKEQVVE
jgi:hypothetical protein